MINIDRISQKSQPYYTGYRYHFPTIDFKFQNTGNATAFLWQFTINVLHAEIDPTPVLYFSTRVEGNALIIGAANNGWGTAHACRIQIKEPILNRLFTGSTRQYRGVIPSGGFQEILRLTNKFDKPDQLKAMSKGFSNHVIHYFPSQETIQGIGLGILNITWSCKDDKNTTYQGDEQIPIYSQTRGGTVLTQDGFFNVPPSAGGGEIPPGTFHGGMDSNTTYITIIDPSRGPYEQTYPISRKIPSGDIERFHIMIGSQMSCHLLIEFMFFIDEAKVVKSKMLDVEIWNPRHSGWHNNYKDGAELSRYLRQQQSQANARQLSQWEIEELNYLQQQVFNYPFLIKE